jgi:anthranilate synthase component 2
MSRLLIIDNYDSFTYNLVQMLAAAGADVTVWRNDAFELHDIERENPDGLVVSPGPCTPTEAGHSVDVIRRYGASVPTLGVCLGHQSIGMAYGARVTQARLIKHGKTSPVKHDGSGIFSGLEGDAVVTRYHSLVIEDVPDELVVNATTDDDGDAVVMGVRHQAHPVWGVQFHPESILTEDGDTMLKTFLAFVRERR